MPPPSSHVSAAGERARRSGSITMTMSQPFKDIWLPKDVEMYFSAMLAIGKVDVRFNLDYSDYREATTAARIKGRGGWQQ